ncbi:MAG TPA: zinc ribbon domain-containing protein [Abditibacterium sp.]|jgi:hypothetical protein
MTEAQQTAQLFGIIVAATVAGFVAADAKRRGLPPLSIFGWGAGVFMALIVFLPLYLFLRKRDGVKPVSPLNVSAECPYCGYQNPGGANFCGKCSRQLKTSAEIHSK